MAEVLSLTGFLLALVAVFIGGEALRRISPRPDAAENADSQLVDTLQRRIDVLEKNLAELKSREKMAGHRFNPELTDSERFAPSHHVLKHHYVA
ncbi:MAG: hypothetical protein RIB59_04765 [Rhodospirillales bacterium]